MRKPKWQLVDWVELGCRGWDIEITGADLGPQIESPWEYDYASLDRQTLHVVMSGRLAFIARVVNDLRAAGLVRIQEKAAGVYEWAFNIGTPYPLYRTTDNTVTTGQPITLKLVA